MEKGVYVAPSYREVALLRVRADLKRMFPGEFAWRSHEDCARCGASIGKSGQWLHLNFHAQQEPRQERVIVMHETLLALFSD